MLPSTVVVTLVTQCLLLSSAESSVSLWMVTKMTQTCQYAVKDKWNCLYYLKPCHLLIYRRRFLLLPSSLCCLVLSLREVLSDHIYKVLSSGWHCGIVVDILTNPDIKKRQSTWIKKMDIITNTNSNEWVVLSFLQSLKTWPILLNQGKHAGRCALRTRIGKHWARLTTVP